jgi:hypothetical protein
MIKKLMSTRGHEDRTYPRRKGKTRNDKLQINVSALDFCSIYNNGSGLVCVESLRFVNQTA